MHRNIAEQEQEQDLNNRLVFVPEFVTRGNPAATRPSTVEPETITRARQYIRERQSEKLSLPEVAKAVNVSTFYFCKLFSKVLGVHFTDYLSNLRIERAKGLLLNRELRVSEIAFEAGFQSLTHFNRVFKKRVGQSPTRYRSQLMAY